MSLACKSWDLIIMGGLKQTSLSNAIFLSIKAKTHWRTILTHCLKNWMQTYKDNWPLECLSWEKWAHSMMKRSILRPSAPCTSMAIRIKWCPSWSLLYLWNLLMALSYTITFVSRLMTLESIVSCIGLISTTLATKT
jgi:hypothetical protein